MDTLTKLSAELGAALKAQGFQLTLAESCTGGMVATAITEIAGSSDWFDCGFVTYSNASKQKMLGVSNDTLDKHGAVSESTAVEMALGALKHSHAQISGSITGIAGPSGGTIEKPVGTVCFAWATKNGALSKTTKHFQGNRQAVRQQAAMSLITGLLEILKTNNL